MADPPKMKTFFYTFLALLVCNICLSQDIVFTSVSGSKNVQQREEFVRDFVLKNSGIISADGFSTNIYFSADNAIDQSDYYIGGRWLSELAAGASVTISLPVGYVGVPPGTYNLIVELDSYKNVTETDEDNNLIVLSGYVVSPGDYDLTIQTLSADKTNYPSTERMLVTLSVANTGTTNLGGLVDVVFYLSEDAVWDGSDRRLDRDTEFIEGPDLLTWSDYVLLLPPKPLGDYYLIVQADTDEKIPETDESNNQAILPFTITSGNVDLEMVSLSPWGSVEYNIVGADVVITNNGTTGTSLESYDFHGSVSLISGENVGSGFFSGSFSDFPKYIGPGETVMVMVEGYVYSGLVAGNSYNLSLLALPDEDINEQNNEISASFFVPFPPTKSARLVSVVPVGSYDNTDLSLELDVTVENNGEAGYFYQYYTLSILDASQNVIATKNIQPLLTMPGTSTVDRTTVTFVSPLPVGNYTVKVACESACDTSPSTISGSLVIAPIQYTLTGSVRGEDGTPLSAGKLFLYQKGDDGVLRFIQKITPTSSSFSFGIDNHEHTLYYIPDPITENDYVPTVYGKTITLTPSSLFTLAGDETRVFEIIKIQPLATGSGIISGYVTSSGETQSMSMRVATSLATQSSGTPEADVPVMLLSASGQVVRVTYTDENGYYEFKNLPREEFGVILSRELDQPLMDEPYPVDITERNMTVDFDLSTEEVEPVESVLMLSQTLDFTAITGATYGDAPISLNATSDSGLPVTFESSDPLIAEINASSLAIWKPGTVTLTAKQQGNNFFNPATSVQTITIDKASQTLTMQDIPSVKFGDAPVPLSASSTSGLAVTFESSDAAIAEINGSNLVIKKPGTVTITAKQDGTEYYAQAAVDKSVEIQKAQQTLRLADIPGKRFGDAAFIPESSGTNRVPILTSSNVSIAAVEDGKIVIKKPGVVIITAQVTEDELYFSSTDSKILSIEKGNSGLTFPQIMEKAYGDPDFNVGVTSGSSEAIRYSSSNNSIAEVVQGVVTIRKPGTVTLTASQAADEFYHASSVSRTLTIRKASQMIELSELPEKTYGDPAFSIGAKASSGLPLEISVSDESVVVFVFGNLLIRNAGTTSITIKQKGNDFYEPAGTLQKTLTIAKAPQTLTFSEIPEKEISDAPFPLISTVNSPLKIEFSSDNENVATVEGNVVTLHGPGVANITAKQPGNGNYLPAVPVTRKLSVEQVTSIETRSNPLRIFPNPVREYFQIDSDAVSTIQIIDALGVIQKDFDLAENRVNVQRLTAGVYFLIVRQGELKSTLRFVKH